MPPALEALGRCPVATPLNAHGCAVVVVLREIDFLLNNLLIDFIASPFWRLITGTQTCSSLNHRKVMKAEPSRLVSRKLTANLELSTVKPNSKSKFTLQAHNYMYERSEPKGLKCRQLIHFAQDKLLHEYV